MSFNELKRQTSVYVSRKYVYAVWLLFAGSLVSSFYLAYVVISSVLSSGPSASGIIAVIYQYYYVTVLVQVLSLAYLGLYLFTIYRLYLSLNVHAQRVAAALRASGIQQAASYADRISSAPARYSLVPFILAVLFWFVPFLEIASLILILYLMSRLHSSVVALEQTEDEAFRALGISLSRRRTGREGYFLYGVLAVVTLGLFMVYLIYHLVSVYNGHVKEDVRLLESVEL
ncbi:MAG: hypothetical protein ACP5LW_05375 [Nitrososphaeria archaeon]